MSMECQVNVKSQSELDIGGRETCCNLTVMQYCNLTLLQYCNLTVLQYCNLSVLHYCNFTLSVCNIVRLPLKSSNIAVSALSHFQ